MAKPGKSNPLGVFGGIVGILASIATIVGVLVTLGVAPNPFARPSAPTPTPRPLTAAEILDRAQSAEYRDMSGTIATTFKFSAPCGLCLPSSGDIVFTANPLRYSSSINTLAGRIFTIVDGTTQYTRQIPPNDAKWVKGQADSTQQNPLARHYYANLTGTNLVGTELIAGHPSYRLHRVQPSASDPSANTTYDLWVRADSFNLIQYTEVYMNATVTATTTLQITVWNAGTIIDLPPPDQIATVTPTPTQTP